MPLPAFQRGYNPPEPLIALLPGTSIGAYQVIAKLGEGGMGEVYRARDTKLDRDVALKSLPESFARDADRLMRFEREAKTLASLNHPNIAAIYGIEDRALVMELVEGEDLSQRIARGAIPIDEAVPIARQIAEALEAAHEQGIIHRDLKPANIKVRSDGTVKVLDFGLAKALEQGPGIGHHGSGLVANSPTITSPAMTMHGVILGTAAYMSPEQAKGRAVDRRTDIWAFGVVLYEMLTGKRAFAGEDITDTIVAVVSKEPDWSRLPAGTPSAMRRVIQRCLVKDAKQRLHDVADARIELSEGPGDAVNPPAVMRSLTWRLAPWALVAALATALPASWLLRPVPQSTGSTYPIGLPEGQRIATNWSPMAVSPDGSHLVYVGESRRLVVRSRNQLDSAELAGTEGAFNPFFSPDGTRVGYMIGQPGNAQLRIVAVAGGPSSLVTADSVGGPGASWGPDGYIYYDFSGIGPLRRVRETGGESANVSTLDSAGGELQHDWPDALPSGKGVLITINRSGPGVNVSDLDDVGVIDLTTGRHRVLAHGVFARYAASGHLLYVTASGALMAAPFDQGRLQVTGTALTLIEGINIRSESGGIDVAISRSGTLWYGTGTRQGQQELVWATAAGEFVPVDAGMKGAFESLALSPDDTKLALTISDTGGPQIWVKDLGRPNGSLSKVTHERTNRTPRWHPDGTRLSFTSIATGSELRSVRADGTGAQSVLASDLYIVEGGWSPDGRWLVYSGHAATTRVFREDIHGVPLAGDAKPVVLADSGFNERAASVSPDGRWLAYESNSTGRYEIYVRPFPESSTAQYVVSSGGGSRPKWSRDGRAIVYQDGANELTGVAVVPGTSFSAGKPGRLFSLDRVLDWDVAADGRIIMIRAAEADRGGQLVVVEDFFEELRRKVPTK